MDAKTVLVQHRAVTSTFTGDRRALRAIERALPRSGWNRGVRPGELIVTSHRADDAVAAVERAGYQVEVAR